LVRNFEQPRVYNQRSSKISRLGSAPDRRRAHARKDSVLGR